MNTLQFTVTSREDIYCVYIALVSLLEELNGLKDKHINVDLKVSDEDVVCGCMEMVEGRFEQVPITVNGDCTSNNVIAVPNNALFTFGAVQKYVEASLQEREDMTKTLTQEDHEVFRTIIEDMQTSCKIPSIMFIFEGQTKQQTASIMHQSLRVLLHVYEGIDRIMESIVKSMEENKGNAVEEKKE